MGPLLYTLPDARLVPVLDALSDRVCKRMTLVISALADLRKEVLQFGRFVRNKRVKPLDVFYPSMLKVDKASEGMHLLLIQDTSEVSFGFEPFQKGLGPVGGGQESGFFLHPVLAMCAETKLCTGLANVEIYQRPSYEREDAGHDPKVRHAMRKKQAFESKSSYRWLSSVVVAKTNCPSAKGHTVVSDREGDIYEALVAYGQVGLGFIVRADVNRPLYGTEHKKLWDQIKAWPLGEGHHYEVCLPPTDKRSAHKALLGVRFGRVNLQRPENPRLKHLSKHLGVYVVEVLESPSTVLGREKPVHWILYTSHPVATFEQAVFVIGCYVERWSIEQVFRTLKSQGLNLEGNLAESYETLANLAVLGLLAAVKVMQLVSAREGNPQVPIHLAFDPFEVNLLERTNPTLEGTTQAQKNPHPKKTLAFAAWVIARMGGWKGYAKERPPGPIRMFNGLRRFEHYLQAAKILADPVNDT